MENILLTILLLVTVSLVITILLQRSEGGALGIGGGQGGGMMSARGAADFLSRATKYLAIAFIACALGLNWLAARKRDDNSAALELIQAEQDAPVIEEQVEPEPDVPTVPDGDAG